MSRLFSSSSEQKRRIRERFDRFRDLLSRNSEILNRIAGAMEMLGGEFVFDRQYLVDLSLALGRSVGEVVLDLNAISGNRYLALVESADRVRTAIDEELAGRPVVPAGGLVLSLDQIDTDLADLVGDKAARLAEVRRRLSCGVPPGFAVTAAAGQMLLDAAGLGRVEAGARSAAIRETPIPREVERRIGRAVELIEDAEETTFAVRSSAIGEDGPESFAGQHLTVLNVPGREVPFFWREVVASLYAPHAVTYRERHGLPDPPEGMAVLVIPMIRAAAAGVLRSFDPAAPDRDVFVIAAAPGLGTRVVGGSAADRFEVARAAPHEVRNRILAEKEQMACLSPQGGVVDLPVPEARRSAPALDDATLARLAETARTIERVLRFALDLEWAVDQDGGLHVLQIRPQRKPVVPDRPSDLVGEPRKRHRVLIEKVGEVGCRGIGAGPVRHLSPDGEGEDDFPAGAVLVAHETSPLLSPCVARASAVVTDVGSAASHLGTVACEFQVPTLLGTGRATELLPEGLVVTVDAEEGVVYEGEVRELLRHQLLRTVPSHSSTEFRLLRRMLRHIAPLNLVDPSDRSFSPAGCRTVHDVLRFAHEKAVAEISRGADRGREHVRELELPVPLDLILVDVGGAVRSGAPPKRIRPEHLACRPLRALLAGLTEPGVWATGPADLDLGGFFSSAIRSQAVASSAGAPVTRNVAVAGGEYLNLNLKLGYHFNVLDCQLGEDAARNYVSFFFVGGVTELLRRARRAELLDRILTARGFRMETRGDLVVGQLSGVSPDKLETELVTMGRLIGFTRQLDVLLRSEEAVSAGVTAFLEGRPPPVESPPPEEGPRRRRRGRRK